LNEAKIVNNSISLFFSEEKSAIRNPWLEHKVMLQGCNFSHFLLFLHRGFLASNTKPKGIKRICIEAKISDK